MPDATKLLDATNVSKKFGEFRAVAGADLAVNEGDIIGLIGPNGAGKSTFFNCLAGETMPSGGQIVFDGKDLTRASPEAHARAGIGRTIQVPTTFADMSVIHNVMVGALILIPLQSATNTWFGGGGSGLTYILYGGIIVLIARFEPGGLFDLWQRVVSRFRSSKASAARSYELRNR